MANLTVQIQELLTLNGQVQNYSANTVYTDIENVYTSAGILPLNTSCVLYQTTSSAWFGNTLAVDSIKYMRIFNSATGSAYSGSASGSYTGSVTNASILRLQISGPSGNSGVSLGPGDNFILTRHSNSFQGNHPGIGGGAVYENITGIKAAAQGGDTSYFLRAYGTPASPY